MTRMIALYTNRPGARFDHDYYLSRHVPMVAERLKPYGLTHAAVNRGVGGAAPGAPAAFLIVATLDFESAEGMQQGMAAHGAEILGDIPNYTDIEPIIQVSEVVAQVGGAAASTGNS